LDTPQNPDDVVVTEDCPDPFYPNANAELIWTFSQSTRLPKTVTLPMIGLTHNIVRPEFVSFERFQSFQARLLPVELTVRQASGRSESLTVANTNFVEKLPDSTFLLGINEKAQQ